MLMLMFMCTSTSVGKYCRERRILQVAHGLVFEGSGAMSALHQSLYFGHFVVFVIIIIIITMPVVFIIVNMLMLMLTLPWSGTEQQHY